MSFKVIINKKAIKDIEETVEYYNKQSYGLGSKFESVLDEFIQVLETNPSFRIRYDKVRCLPIKTFPYMIHFSINEKREIVKIHAVLNTKRNPKIWENRTK